MTKKEVAKGLRKKLTEAIRSLPDDIEFQSVSLFEDVRDLESRYGGNATGDEGAIHVIELTVEEVRCENAD